MPSLESHLDELIEKRQQVTDDMEGLVTSPDFDPDGDAFSSLQRSGEQLDKQIEHVEKTRQNRMAADQWHKLSGRGPAQMDPRAMEDVGQALVTSESFQRWKRAGASGRAKLLEVPLQRALITTADLPSTNDRVYANGPVLPTPLLNVLNRQQVSSGAVDVVTYGAAPDAAIVAEGALKPEAALTIDVVTKNLVTLAHWAETSRQAVEDESRLRDFVSNSLLRGVYGKAETEAATAIQNGTYDAAQSPDSLMKAIRLGVALVQDKGYTPNAVLVNPLDAAELDFFVWDNTGGQSQSVWGLSVVASSKITAGSAFVGDFAAGVHHYYRASAEIFVTDSDVGAAGESNFKRNILTWLGEMRAVTAVVRADAIAEASVGTPVAARASAPTHQVKK